MKGWDERMGASGRFLSFLFAVFFLLLGGVYLVDVLRRGSFDIQTTDKLTVTFLFWGVVLVIVSVRGKLF